MVAAGSEAQPCLAPDIPPAALRLLLSGGLSRTLGVVEVDLVVIIAVGVSWLFHSTVRNATLAGITSVLVSLPIIALVGQPHFGWFDKAFWDNLVVSGFVSAAITILVGALLRRNQHSKHDV